MAGSERAHLVMPGSDNDYSTDYGYESRVDYRMSDSYRAYRMAVAQEEERARVPAHQKGHKVKRTRVRPAAAPRYESPARNQALSVMELRQLIAAAVCVALLLTGFLVLNAHAANIQCNINALTKANLALEDEIDVLNMKIDSSTSISQIETYAMKKLKMRYPQGGQSIYIGEDATLMDNFALVIKRKAYGLEDGEGAKASQGTKDSKSTKSTKDKKTN